jgi:hypothetical protein
MIRDPGHPPRDDPEPRTSSHCARDKAQGEGAAVQRGGIEPEWVRHGPQEPTWHQRRMVIGGSWHGSSLLETLMRSEPTPEDLLFRRRHRNALALGGSQDILTPAWGGLGLTFRRLPSFGTSARCPVGRAAREGA